jgi:hypothetical protein
MADSRKQDDIDFVKEAFASLRTRRVLVPALLIVLLQAASAVAMPYTLPTAAHPDHSRYLAVLLLLLLGLLGCSVALLRILNASPRPPWQPDASLWLLGLALIACALIDAAAYLVVGGQDDLLAGLASGSLSIAITAPLAPWITAIAVERPLALRPRDHMRNFAAWLPAFLLWELLIVVPLGQFVALLNKMLMEGAGGWFWPVVLLYGLLGTVIELVSCALSSVAYRRVARS